MTEDNEGLNRLKQIVQAPYQMDTAQSADKRYYSNIEERTKCGVQTAADHAKREELSRLDTKQGG